MGFWPASYARSGDKSVALNIRISERFVFRMKMYFSLFCVVPSCRMLDTFGDVWSWNCWIIYGDRSQLLPRSINQDVHGVGVYRSRINRDFQLFVRFFFRMYFYVLQLFQCIDCSIECVWVDYFCGFGYFLSKMKWFYFGVIFMWKFTFLISLILCLQVFNAFSCEILNILLHFYMKILGIYRKFDFFKINYDVSVFCKITLRFFIVVKNW